MNDVNAVREALTEIFPDYCDIVGPTVTERIVASVFAGKPSNEIAKHVAGGNDTDWLHIVQFLAAATTVAKNVIDLSKLLYESEVRAAGGTRNESEQNACEHQQSEKVIGFIQKVSTGIRPEL